MDTTTKILFGIFGLLCLTLGVVGSQLIGVKEVVKEVPVTNTVTKEVQVVKEVPVPVNVTVDLTKESIAKAQTEFLADLTDKDNLECNDVRYDASEVTLSKLFEGATVSTESHRTGSSTTVEFSERLKFADNSGDHPCYKTYDVTVVFSKDANGVAKDTSVDY